MFEELAERVVIPLVLGAVGGAIRSVAGYLDARRDKKVEWSWKKASQSLVRGGVSGFLVSLTAIGGVGGVVEALVTILSGVGGDVLIHDVGIKK